jgi:predicted nucleic acid-binding protein
MILIADANIIFSALITPKGLKAKGYNICITTTELKKKLFKK